MNPYMDPWFTAVYASESQFFLEKRNAHFYNKEPKPDPRMGKSLGVTCLTQNIA